MITLKDIAKKTGVNVSTVSRALNDSSEINDETKKYIKKIAEELNYAPNLTAKALAGKGTKSVGIILPEIVSNYYSQVVNYVEGELMETGYSLIVGFTNFAYTKEIEYLEVFKKRNVDGIILVGSMYKEIAKHLKKVKHDYKIPMVLIESFVHYPDYDYIMIDDAYGISEGINFLKTNGHKEIGFIGDLSSNIRHPMFKAAIKEKGLDYNEKFVKIGKERFESGGYLRMKEFLSEKKLPTAIVASYDNIAIGAMKAIYETGMKIPDDISIIGYDNIRDSAFLYNSLTTVSPPIKEMAQIGVKLLVDKIEDKGNKVIQHISLKPELIIRDTVGKLNK